jgi:hypothetical protein
VSGDAWQVDWHAGVCRLTVVDGLGHGPLAAEAARRATEGLATAPALDPLQALSLCHDLLRGTRGAAISVASIDVGAGRLRYCGVGNVEARLFQGERPARLLIARGIVGAVMPRLRTEELELGPGWLLLVHTDGVSSRMAPETLPEFAERRPQVLADALLAGWAHVTDDATVVVVSPAAAPGVTPPHRRS